MQVAMFLTNVSGAIWWPKWEQIQVLVAKFATNKVTLAMLSLLFVFFPFCLLLSFDVFLVFFHGMQSGFTRLAEAGEIFSRGSLNPPRKV